MTVRSIVGAAAALAVAAAPAAAAAPPIQQLVAFKSGDAKQRLVKAAGTEVRVGSKRCAVGADTPLAALLDARLPGVKLKDYGSCSSHPADAAGLYVARIRKDVAKGANGWVYKVGNRSASSGAGDPSGPFGNGLLKPNARVTWFYCHMKATGCQRTLAIKATPTGSGQVNVTVRGYDDRGKAKPVANATVHAGSATATTAADGTATLTTSPGPARLYATAKGLVRSFEEPVDVK